MKAITLHQPWATFIALGIKHFETRSWGTAYRGPIAIHAGKVKPEHIAIMHEDFAEILAELELDPLQFPSGAVVATADLTDCIPTTVDFFTSILFDHPSLEFIMGNYDLGRFAWKLENVIAIDPPIPARGMQGLWDWDETSSASLPPPQPLQMRFG